MKETSGVQSGVMAAMRYEFLMQIRRKAVWITFAAFSVIFIGDPLTPWSPFYEDIGLSQVVANWSLSVQGIHPIVFGLLLADRLSRDRRTGTLEILDTLPVAMGGRFLGKYLGATLATLTPILVIWGAGIVYIVSDSGSLVAIPQGFTAFLTINLPGLLFVAAFSIACPAILWVPLYQFLFIGYWFWGNLFPPGLDMPTLSDTILTPLGGYAASGFFGVNSNAFGVVNKSVWEGLASMSLLLFLGALALYCGHRVLVWQRAGQ